MLQPDPNLMSPASAAPAFGWMPRAWREHPAMPRLARWLRLLAAFFAGQGLLQVLMVLSGFFLLRWMRVEDYAIFSVSFSLQNLMAALVDPGFSSAVVPMVGARTDDPVLAGGYVAAARSLRNIMLPWSLVAGVGAFAVLGHRQGWSPAVIAVLAANAAVGTWLYASVNLNCQPLLLRQRLGALHTAQNVVAGLRFAVYLTGHLASSLVAVVPAMTHSVCTGLTGFLFGRAARGLVDEPAAADPARKRDILLFVAPQLPFAVYGAFAGQISTFLITIFGKTRNVAEVGALGRLNQLFTIFTVLYGWVVTPYFAKLPPELVARRFVQLVAVLALGFGVLVAGSFRWPEPLRWLLGAHYQGLGSEIGWTVANGAAASLFGLVYAAAYARRWLRWGGGLVTILSALVVQLVMTALVNLSATRDVILVSFAANATLLLILTAICAREAMGSARPAHPGA